MHSRQAPLLPSPDRDEWNGRPSFVSVDLPGATGDLDLPVYPAFTTMAFTLALSIRDAKSLLSTSSVTFILTSQAAFTPTLDSKSFGQMSPDWHVSYILATSCKA